MPSVPDRGGQPGSRLRWGVSLKKEKQPTPRESAVSKRRRLRLTSENRFGIQKGTLEEEHMVPRQKLEGNPVCMASTHMAEWNELRFSMEHGLGTYVYGQERESERELPLMIDSLSLRLIITARLVRDTADLARK